MTPIWIEATHMGDLPQILVLYVKIEFSYHTVALVSGWSDGSAYWESAD